MVWAAPVQRSSPSSNTEGWSALHTTGYPTLRSRPFPRPSLSAKHNRRNAYHSRRSYHRVHLIRRQHHRVGKLNGRIKDITFKGQHTFNLLLFAIVLGLAIFLLWHPAQDYPALFYGLFALALLYGIAFVLPYRWRGHARRHLPPQLLHRRRRCLWRLPL